MKKHVSNLIKEQPPQTHRKVMVKYESVESDAVTQPKKPKLQLRKKNFAFIAVAVLLALSIPIVFATAANTNEVAKIEEIGMQDAASASATPDDPSLDAATEGELVSDVTVQAPVTPEPTPTPTPEPEPTPEPTPTPDPEPVYTVLSSGMNDPFVSDIQQRLMDLDYMEHDETTTLYGPVTTQAIEYFQRKNGLPVDGIAGIETQELLFSEDAKHYTVSEGADGPDVQSMQERLVELGYSVSADGNFGPATTAAVKYFQRMNGLTEDGNVGKGTREVLYSKDAEPSLEYGNNSSSSDSSDEDGESTTSSADNSESSDAPASSDTSASDSSDSSDDPAPAANSGSAEAFINAALAQQGKTYVLGGKGPDVFDCSGLVYYALKASGNGISYMTSYGWAEADQYTRINSMSELQRGDVVCENGHVGIYLGDGQIVHASSSNGQVIISGSVFSTSYWTENFICGRRPF